MVRFGEIILNRGAIVLQGSQDELFIRMDKILTCGSGDHLSGGAWHFDRHLFSSQTRAEYDQDPDHAGPVWIAMMLSLLVAGIAGIVLGFMLNW